MTYGLFLGMMSSVPEVVVVPALRPEVGRALVCERDRADALDCLKAVLDSGEEPQRRAVFERERRTVDLVAQECLRMERARNVQLYVVPTVWCRESHIARRTG